MAELDPPEQLRLCLTVGNRPTAELLKEINHAIQLSDCWKFARLLTIPERAIDATTLLSACQAMIKTQTRPDVRLWGRGLLSIARLWQGGEPPPVPTYSTVAAFLSSVTRLLDDRISQTELAKAKKSDPRPMLMQLLAISLALVVSYPSVSTLTMGAELLSKAANRHSIDPESISFSPQDSRDRIDELWARLKAELDSALTNIRLGDAQTLLRAMSIFPRRASEFQDFITSLRANPDNLDQASRQLLSQYDDSAGDSLPPIAFAPEISGDLETTELARVLMKAWDVSSNLAPGSELAEEIIATLNRLFGLRLIGSSSETVPYQTHVHEFERGAAVSDAVRVVRPGVQKIASDKSSIIFKSVVRASKENSNVD